MLGSDHAASWILKSLKQWLIYVIKFLSLGNNEKFLKSETILKNILLRKFVTTKN